MVEEEEPVDVRAVRLGGEAILTGAARVLSLIARASVESSLCHLSTSAWVPNDLYFSLFVLERRITVLCRDSDSNSVYDGDSNVDFPLLSVSSLWTKDNTPICYYTAGTTFQEDWASLKVSVGRDYVPRTMSVMCPKIGNQTAFMSKFSDEGRSDNLLLDYRPSRPHDKRKYIFDRPPPEFTGLDPLRKVDKYFLLERVQSLRKAARPLKSSASPALLHESDLKKLKGGKKTTKALREVCSSVVVAIEEVYGTMRGVCDSYRNSSEEAVGTAIARRWPTEKEGLFTHFIQP
ncbi:hypothetical protein FOL46_007419 [Perkinsus olseni]|uniref:Uncharacterized protein n=1 Tax=Perkinsus olseni TaxID=32597 RepID=A0A7J6LE20_PEROL|nr:hypothetical protein FOL46_007419 [Perkinsus olseni]